MLQMEQQAKTARNYFRAGNYEEAEKLFVPLSEEKSINQPLYQCELASIYLLEGKKDEALQILLSAHESIEGFFDQKSEKKAASLWGRESDKVFKGEPYERGTLYLLLALSMLEKGDVDNALAALKTGLLADSDTEAQTYKADFGLLQFMAAKCYELRKEEEMRGQMLAAAFDSFTSIPSISSQFSSELIKEYNERKAQELLLLPPTHLLTRLCSLVSAGKIEQWLLAVGVEAEEAAAVSQWAHNTTADVDSLDFNALAVVWHGTGPGMTRAGEYGEVRMISTGIRGLETQCSVLVDGEDYDPCGGFGDLSYQATTRGGREMDNVLGGQAAFKGAMDSGSGVAMNLASQDYGDPMVNLAALGVGLLLKGVAAATKTEADIRHWSNLPHSFEIVPLKLASGAHSVQIREWRTVIPVSEYSVDLNMKGRSPFSVLHLVPPRVSIEEVGKFINSRMEDTSVYYLCLASRESVDINSDGELSAVERTAAYDKLRVIHDMDSDGTLSLSEQSALKIRYNGEFKNGMVVK